MADVEEKAKSLLFQLAESSIETTASSLLSMNSDAADEAEFFAMLSKCVVDAAVAPGSSAKMFVQFVLELLDMTKSDEKSQKSLKRALLTAVQTEYNSIWRRDIVKYVGCDDAESQDQPMIHDANKVEWLGFVEFLGLLYVNGVVPEVVLRSVLDQFAELRGSPDENLVEGICQLLLTDGVVYKLYSTKKGEGFITQWKGLNSMKDFSKKKTKYLDLKSTFEGVLSIVEHKGKVPRSSKPAKEASPQDVGGRSPGKGARAERPAQNHGEDRFAALVEHDSSPTADRRGKGYSKGSGDKGVSKEDQNLPDPRQIFVAGIGNSSEDEIKAFFQQVGDIARVKVLRTPEGVSKDVSFITFRSEEQAQDALRLHGTSFAGKNITIRIANGKKGSEKGSGGKGGPASPSHGPIDRPGPEGSQPDLGGSSRFDALAGQSPTERLIEDIGGLPPPRAKGKSSSKGGGRGKGEWMSELDTALEEALSTGDCGPVKVTDFDFTSKRFLSELRQRDRLDGTQRFQAALDFVFEYTAGKDRSAVKKWTAYVFKLLQKSDTEFADGFQKREEERRRQQLPLRGGDDEG